MPQTYEQNPIQVLEDFGASDPTAPGSEIFSNGAFRRCDSVGVYDPRSVWVSPHNTTAAISHAVQPWAGSAVAAVTTGQPFPSQVTWYYDAGMTKKAVQTTYTRNGLQQATQVATVVYASDGATVVNTCTDTVTYSGGFEVGRTRANT